MARPASREDSRIPAFLAQNWSRGCRARRKPSFQTTCYQSLHYPAGSQVASVGREVGTEFRPPSSIPVAGMARPASREDSRIPAFLAQNWSRGCRARRKPSFQTTCYQSLHYPAGSQVASVGREVGTEFRPPSSIPVAGMARPASREDSRIPAFLAQNWSRGCRARSKPSFQTTCYQSLHYPAGSQVARLPWVPSRYCPTTRIQIDRTSDTPAPTPAGEAREDGKKEEPEIWKAEKYTSATSESRPSMHHLSSRRGSHGAVHQGVAGKVSS
jgi:hypothetical protein